MKNQEQDWTAEDIAVPMIAGDFDVLRMAVAFIHKPDDMPSSVYASVKSRAYHALGQMYPQYPSVSTAIGGMVIARATDWVRLVEEVCRLLKYTTREVCSTDLHVRIVAKLEQAGMFNGIRKAHRFLMLIDSMNRAMEEAEGINKQLIDIASVGKLWSPRAATANCSSENGEPQ